MKLVKYFNNNSINLFNNGTYSVANILYLCFQRNFDNYSNNHFRNYLFFNCNTYAQNRFVEYLEKDTIQLVIMQISQQTNKPFVFLESNYQYKTKTHFLLDQETIYKFKQIYE